MTTKTMTPEEKRIRTRSPERLAWEMIEAVEDEQAPTRAIERAFARIKVVGAPRKRAIRYSL